jgi:hypothetical protein
MAKASISGSERENANEKAKLGWRQERPTHFPSILHSILSKAEQYGYSHIISWRAHGRCFHVHDRDKFVNDVMPLFFRQTRFASFQRQLNLYGFIRMSQKNPDHGAYYHHLFLKGKSEFCEKIQRVGKSAEARASRLYNTEPNFYSISQLVDAKKEVPTDGSETITETEVLGNCLADLPEDVRMIMEPRPLRKDAHAQNHQSHACFGPSDYQIPHQSSQNTEDLSVLARRKDYLEHSGFTLVVDASSVSLPSNALPRMKMHVSTVPPQNSHEQQLSLLKPLDHNQASFVMLPMNVTPNSFPSVTLSTPVLGRLRHTEHIELNQATRFATDISPQHSRKQTSLRDDRKRSPEDDSSGEGEGLVFEYPLSDAARMARFLRDVDFDDSDRD